MMIRVNRDLIRQNIQIEYHSMKAQWAVVTMSSLIGLSCAGYEPKILRSFIVSESDCSFLGEDRDEQVIPTNCGLPFSPCK